jgi:hypothetical protein
MMFTLVGIILVGVVANDNSIERVSLGLGNSGYKGTVYVGDTLTETVVYYTGGNYTRASIPGSNSSSEYVYTYRMTDLVSVDADTADTDYAVIPLAALPTYTIIFGLYGLDFMMLGPVSPELDIHLFRLGCNPSLVYKSFPIDMTRSEHQISDDGVCGTGLSDTISIACATSTRGPVTILSASALELGVHKTVSGEYCFYTPNHFEVSLPIAWISVWILILIMLTVVDLTADLVTDPVKTLNKLSVHNATGINDILVFSAIFNLYVAARHNHTIYGFAVMRAVSKDVIDYTIVGFAYGLCPLLTGGAMWALVAGAMSFDLGIPTTNVVGTWGKTPTNLPLSLRLPIMILATTSGSVCAWYTAGILGGDLASQVITTISTALFILHASTPTLISHVTGPGFEPRQLELVIYIRWCSEFMPVASLIVAIPHNIVGILTTPYNVMILAGLGVAMIVVTARDAAFLDVLLHGRWSRHLIHPVVLAVLWYLTLFTITPVFANTDALGNNGRLALLSATASTAALFSSSFMVYHG